MSWRGPAIPEMECIDYGRSYVCTTGPANAPRFWVESRCRIMDEQHDTYLDFCQCGSCKSENTFAEKNLFQAVNYDFLPVFGEDQSYAIFRRQASFDAHYAEFGHAESPLWQGWGTSSFELFAAEPIRLLDTNEMIIEATMKALPIIGQTEIWHSMTLMRAIIEYPVKTMNINEARRLYQVDTGPVLLPDLECRFERPVESLRLAFVAFNVPHFADFVVEQPTSVTVNGKEVCKVHHYSGIQTMDAVNTLWAIGEP